MHRHPPVAGSAVGRPKRTSSAGLASPVRAPSRWNARWSWHLIAPTIFAAGLALFAPRPGVWLDEAATVSAASRSWGNLWLLAGHQDRSLVGYYALTKGVADLVDCDPLTAGRAISAFCYVLAVCTASLLAANFWGRTAAFASGMMLAVLPATAGAAVNARPESLSVFLVAVYFYAAVKRWPFIQAASALLACSAYALNVLYIPLAILIPTLVKRQPTRSDIAYAGILSAVGGGWLLVCANQQKQVSWIHTDPWSDIVASFIRIGVSAPTSHINEPLVTALSVALGISLTLLTVTLLFRRSTRRQAATLLALWTLPPLVACGVVLAGKDIFVARYFTPSSIGISLILGLTASHVRVRSATHRVAIAMLMLACIPSFLSSHAPDGHWGENLNLHLAAIRAAGPQQVTFVAPRNRATLFASGHLEQDWRNATWWREAQKRGQLWGPPDHAPQKPILIILDTRLAKKRLGLPGCPFTRSQILHQEARFTSISATCSPDGF